MDIKHSFIWAVKSASTAGSASSLEKLSESKTLFDENSIDKSSQIYSDISRSFDAATKESCFIVTYIDELYPDSLKMLPFPPPVLYVKGNLNALNHGAYVGIVGSRYSDAYGNRMALKIAAEIAQTGIGIISGGAMGIDSAAHLGALNVHGTTLAVMGCGLDTTYPKSNARLFDKIVSNGGALVSEFHFGTPPIGKNFPKRNRIIAAMSTTLAVIRAGVRSGSLITARIAEELSKNVYSMPGNIDNCLSAGTNELIQDGACVLTSSSDIIDEVLLKRPDFFLKNQNQTVLEENSYIAEEKVIPHSAEKSPLKEFSDNEYAVYKAIESGFCTADEIENNCPFDSSRLTATLSILELKGVIKKGFDKKYRINSGGNS